MIYNVPVLRLNQHQLAQLMVHLTSYRSYLWQRVMPTPERNQTIYAIQTMQGRLEQKQGQADSIFPVSREEGRILQQIFSGLMQLHGTAPPSEQRLQILGEVASLRTLIERMLRQTQVF